MAFHSSILSPSVYLLLFLFSSALALEVTYDARALKFDGERKLIFSGAIHYPRSPPEMWPDVIRKAKEGGINTIETYVFWNAHEPQYRQYDFAGNLDFIRFFQTVQNEGLYVFLRIGPYVCAEWNYGGFPLWLHNMPGIRMRTNNDVYKKEMETFTTLIINMAKEAKLFASQGGPIILAQIENEYGDIDSPFGEDGKEYVKWAAQMAVNQGISEPWIMCQQPDAPPPTINTCNGFYCDSFTPNRNDVPKLFTEMWDGWFQKWGDKNPHRAPEDVAYSIARFFQKGGSLVNYYMFYGGTNFGRYAGPYITTSYDYDAPLDEYGNYNQPKFGHLKQLHEILLSVEKNLLYGDVRTITISDTVEATIYSLGGNSTCFIANWDKSSNDASVSFLARNYSIPAWSVSILADCNQETYNTAKINVQTSVLEKKQVGGDLADPQPLQWQWRSEVFLHLRNPDKAKDVFTANRLIDQKEVNDTSDYFWYMTSVTLDEGDDLLGKPTLLYVNSSGPILHAYVNGQYIGYQYGTGHDNFNFVFEKPVVLVKGVNWIQLLSVTIGFPHYGAFFDEIPVGVTGPVKLIANYSDTTITKDLTNNQWYYKIGIYGESRKFFSGRVTRQRWHDQYLISNQRFIWYKSTFDTPVGSDPVVLDFKGLGKGTAWVNGQSIGRYWVTAESSVDNCHDSCDYRGKYDGGNKCQTNCGKPTQRWYHVPRAFLNNVGNNSLVLFEEFGGNPSFVLPQTVSQTKACANAYQGNTLTLSCPEDRTISEITFASFGNPQGTCGLFKKGTCESTTALATITNACVGRSSCTFDVNEMILGPTGCFVTVNKLAVEALC